MWDSGNTAGQVSGATFDANTALYGGAISHSWASAALTISDCMFIGNSAVYVPDDSVLSDDPPPVPTTQGGAVWNDANSTGVVTISGSPI